MMALAARAAAAQPQVPGPVPQAPAPATARGASAQTLEATRPTLGNIARRQATSPTAENERRLGDEYVRQGILDAAYDHFEAALRLDPHDAHSQEGIARIWRDWGFPHRGLSSAYRAVYWAPESASAHNTLGTLLLNLGFVDGAHDRFERARQLDPEAAYPLNNLCYSLLAGGRAIDAVDLCRAAVAADSQSEQVRNNLAMALARTGDFEGAADAFDSAPHSAAGAYNQGVFLLAAQQPERARAALARSRTVDPSFVPALRLLRKLAAPRTDDD
jgi:Flp pilus assembly protein TadD